MRENWNGFPIEKKYTQTNLTKATSCYKEHFI